MEPAEVQVIAEKQALKRVTGLGSEALQSLVVRRLTGEDRVPVGPSYVDEASEDLVIALLSSAQVTGELRKAVLAGCQDTYAEVLRRIALSSDKGWLRDVVPTVVRVSRVVDLTTPEELRSRACALLDLALEECDDPVILGAAVRAVMNYPKSLADSPFWERLTRNRQTAAYGISVLIELNIATSRLEELLCDMWRRRVDDHWPVDAAFLLQRAATIRGSTDIIAHVIVKLSREGCWCEVATELRRRAWSREWLRYARKDRPSATIGEPVIVGARGSTQRLRIGWILIEPEGRVEALARVSPGRGWASTSRLEVVEGIGMADVAATMAVPDEILEEVQVS